jgi:hypothetical protein
MHHALRSGSEEISRRLYSSMTSLFGCWNKVLKKRSGEAMAPEPVHRKRKEGLAVGLLVKQGFGASRVEPEVLRAPSANRELDLEVGNAVANQANCYAGSPPPVALPPRSSGVPHQGIV